jgi:hypothetical protein
MTKHLFVFLGTFILGVVLALAVRAAWFKPYAEHSGHPAAPQYAAMVSNPSAPATTPAPAPTSADPHAGHASRGGSPAVVSSATVNTICAICGMEVDPELPTAIYQGKKIGFGCAVCPPKFAADPERYGPAALRNIKAK